MSLTPREKRLKEEAHDTIMRGFRDRGLHQILMIFQPKGRTARFLFDNGLGIEVTSLDDGNKNSQICFAKFVNLRDGLPCSMVTRLIGENISAYESYSVDGLTLFGVVNELRLKSRGKYLVIDSLGYDRTLNSPNVVRVPDDIVEAFV